MKKAKGRAERQRGETVALGVEVRESVKRRLDVYAAKQGLNKKDVVDAAIDEYLRARRA